MNTNKLRTKVYTAINKQFPENMMFGSSLPYLQSCDIIEFPKWQTSFKRLCSKQRKIVWKVIKTKIQRRIDDIRNAEDLKTVVAKSWTSLQLHYIRSLYDSIPMRLRVVLRARGNITKY
jgi:hypothetical protein